MHYFFLKLEKSLNLLFLVAPKIIFRQKNDNLFFFLNFFLQITALHEYVSIFVIKRSISTRSFKNLASKL